MKTYMPLNGLRWSHNSGSANCDMPQSVVFGRPGGGRKSGKPHFNPLRKESNSYVRGCKRFQIVSEGFRVHSSLYILSNNWRKVVLLRNKDRREASWLALGDWGIHNLRYPPSMYFS